MFIGGSTAHSGKWNSFCLALSSHLSLPQRWDRASIGSQTWSLIQKYLWPLLSPRYLACSLCQPRAHILTFHLWKLWKSVHGFYCRVLVGGESWTRRMVAGGLNATVVPCGLVSVLCLSSPWQCFNASVRENHPQWGEEARPGNAIVWFYLPSVYPSLPVASTWREQPYKISFVGWDRKKNVTKPAPPPPPPPLALIHSRFRSL